MDITLKRIIEELKIQKKKQIDLTNFLGLTHNNFGNWKNGRNTSYLKYIHAIASYLDVSVEYLKGETDIKKPPIENDERLDEVYELVKDLDESEQMALKAFVAGLKANRKPD
jgi:transcriptional regulator with XRE-family HTH domain